MKVCLCLLLLSCVAPACGGSAASSGNGSASQRRSGTQSPAVPHTIAGRIATHAGEPVRIQLYQVGPRGAVSLWSPDVLEARGGERFTLRTGAPMPGPYALLSVESPSATLSALVDLAHAPKILVPAPIPSWETTVESEALLRSLRGGHWKPHHSLARLRGIITPQVAEATLQSTDFGAAVESLVKAALSSMDAWHAVAAKATSQQKLYALEVRLARRRAALDLELLDAREPREVQEAQERFEQDQQELFTAAELHADTLMVAAAAAADALEEASADSGTALRTALRQTARTLRQKYRMPELAEGPG